MLTNINYSIIIPHKNSAGLLQRCLDSIPQRDDIQIIIIDDNSLNIKKLRDIEKKYSYVEMIYTKEGRGAGYARNVGLKQIKGKWVLFADADDFYNKNAFSILDNYINSDNDIIYFFANSLDVNTLLPTPREKGLQNIYEKYDSDNIRSADYIRFKNWAPWNKMIRSDFWFKYRIFFDEIPFGNDLNFSMKISFLAKRYEIITNRLYCLTYSSNSVTYKARSYELESLSLILRAQLNIYFKRLNRPLWHQYAFIYLLQIFQREGGKYGWGYINYLFKNRKHIQQQIKINKTLIDNFLKLNVENRT